MVTDVSSLRIVPRYAEIDQQGVVFNGHYLTWFDEACTALLGDHGVDYAQLMSTGVDFKVVHSDIDYLTSVRWRDGVRVEAVCDHVGTTSFAVTFTVLRTAPDDPQATEQVAVRSTVKVTAKLVVPTWSQTASTRTPSRHRTDVR